MTSSSTMGPERLEEQLSALRRFRTDHQYVEAKRARTSLPNDLWKTLSAFANGHGGLLLLGVDEASGFAITGVEEPSRAVGELQALSAQMEPPLRPAIDLIEHPDGVVVAARFPPVARHQRPCYLASQGPHGGSYIRTGDGDHQMSAAEVGELLALRQREDYSKRPAPPSVRLDPALVQAFCQSARATSEKFRNTTDEQLLHWWGATLEDGTVTVAGALALGENPRFATPAARIAYRRLPDRTAPAGARHSGASIEGTIGEMLDGALTALQRDLTTFQIEEESGVVDDTDVPLVALREIVANALLHRSLSPTAENQSVVVEVSPAAVRVVSPGGLHVAVDPEQIGLMPFPSVRNDALVRICQLLRTPAGHRIIESQAMGIPAADRACRHRGVAPPVFADHPGFLEVVFLRGRLVLSEPVPQASELTAEDSRLLAWAFRYDQLRGEVDSFQLHAASLDLPLAARLCPPDRPEQAAVRLHRLEEKKLLLRLNGGIRSTWVLPPALEERGEQAEATPKRGRSDRTAEVLQAIAAHGGEASRAQIGDFLALSSSKSVIGWINRSMDKGLIEPTTESPFDAGRAYRLTRSGKAVVSNRSKGTA